MSIPSKPPTWSRHPGRRPTRTPAISPWWCPAGLLEQKKQTQFIFSIVMICIAGISLLVGGIGIMNIMLATVLERTREIGIRRAIGARQADIVRQFLTEAIMISIAGGLIGIAFGFALSQIIASAAGWSTVVTGSSIASRSASRYSSDSCLVFIRPYRPPNWIPSRLFVTSRTMLSRTFVCRIDLLRPARLRKCRRFPSRYFREVFKQTNTKVELAIPCA
jgi:hypothetical protein